MSAYDHQIDELLGKMTVAEKVFLCHASTKFSVKGIERLGIPDIVMSDGPHGVRREISLDSWDPVDTDEDFSTYLPTGTALAATWNTEMARLHGEVLGAESRERGKDIILGPGFNIVRSPICGRNFEYYSEDPCHISKLVPHAVKGAQSQGVAACAKHYALNSQEKNRSGVNALASERALREIYLPGFEAAVVEGEVLTVMGSYNKFRGQWCCQNDYLLNKILKDEWGFKGATVSDWNGVHDTYEAAYCGMDIEMGTALPYEKYYLAKPFEEAIERGEIDVEVVDDKVRRILHVLFEIGAIGEKKNSRPAGERNTDKHHEACRTIAREAMVLLKNEGGVLPLDPAKLKKVLVVGDNAVVRHHSGGQSSAVKALYEITPLEGITNVLGDGVEVEHMPDP
ncbi:MAG: glycoside hydrolase family 3 protein, partial [Planctomycetes bacterium]|nr:glycoside hydrolase family 3 protein [Planctomycetota bacterium]